jgi:hypothetical protein
MLLGPFALALLPAVQGPAQEPAQGAAQEPEPEPLQPAPTEPAWSLSLDTYWVEPPDDSGYLIGILYADRGQLHLEARYAYEDRDTASVFAGWRMPWEGTVSGSVTPMIGVAFGETDGVVPALSLEVGWGSFAFTSELEYLIGTSSESEDFFYSWSELTWSPSARFTLGLVGQRTNVFDQELEIDRGFLVGLGLGPAWLTAYVFNPDQDAYVTVGLSAGF